MPRKTTGRAPITRLLRLLLLLQSNRFPNARTLSEDLGVGRRTIFRDFVALEDAGLEIEYHPDRLGYGLIGTQKSRTTPVHEGEVASLVLMAELWGGRDGLGLIRKAREGLIKVIGGLPIEARERINALIQPHYEGLPERPEERRPVYDGLLDSLARRVQVGLAYQDPQNASLLATKVSPYRIVLAQTMWCVIGRSTFHRKVRLFRVPYIRELTTTTDPYSIPPRFDMTRYLAGIWVGDPDATTQDVWLRFTGLVAPEVEDAIWHPKQSLEKLADGRVELRFSSQTGDDLVRWVLGFGDQVEILSPLSLRHRVREVAQRVWRRHAPLSISEGQPLVHDQDQAYQASPFL